MTKRIGFIGIVLEDLAQSPRVNGVIGQYGDMITGRIGVPDAKAGMAVIGLLVKGTGDRIGALTGKLGNIPGVSVKSALTSKVLAEDDPHETQE